MSRGDVISERMARHQGWCPAINAVAAERYGNSRCDCGFVMNLPEDKTCGDCAHLARCAMLFGCNALNVRCDWAPSRFREWPEEGMIEK